ncbi:copper homeostasis protein CutC [Dielma fastidiosa]|uniref:copper homeostasis protein CutC n=1 Tax=Dielma fastidiosa TaxID=1034346 RepID=UPI003566F457
MKTLVEICCGSYHDALMAQNGKADRIELNSALFMGGLTPSIGTLKLVKRDVSLPVICMVRPRGAGFCYNDAEIECIFEDAKALLEAGSDGLAFGFLKADATIDLNLTKRMIALIKSYGTEREAVFHRAFDCVKDAKQAMSQLIECGIDRVLTSGLAPTAIAGKELIHELQSVYGDQIEILAGSGIKAHNAVEFIKTSGVSQVHSSAKAWVDDPTTDNGMVSYAYHHELDYDVVSETAVKELVNIIREAEDHACID